MLVAFFGFILGAISYGEGPRRRIAERLGIRVDADEAPPLELPRPRLPTTGRISSRFGMRRDPIEGNKRRWHSGMDIAGKPGEPVRSMDPGIVREVGWDSGWGWFVEIDDGRTRKLYAHLMTRPLVWPSKAVSAGEALGFLGSSGRSTGPHLHFELRDVGGRLMDPGPLIASAGRDQ